MKKLSNYVAAPRCRTLMAAMLAASALTVPLVPALAQVAEAEAADDNVIIVTAQRRAEALEEVPMSVAVVTTETLASAGITSLRDLANVTSGFTLNQAGAFPQPTMRGITSIVAGNNFEGNVAIYVDGLYQISPQAINIDLPNIAGIQVLKGPQGTLYGRNATGGALLLDTITPGQELLGKLELTYARFDDKRVSGFVSTPLSDKVAFSVAGYLRRSDGYNKLASRTTPGATAGDATPLEQDSVRTKLRFDASDTFRATLGYAFTRVSDGRGSLFSLVENILPKNAPSAATLPKRLDVVAYDIGTTILTRQHEGSLTLELDTGIGTLKSITGYTEVDARTEFDFDGSYLNGQRITTLVGNRTLQQAIDYGITAINNVDLVIGASYFKDKVIFLEPSALYSGAGTNPGTVEQPLSSYTQLSQTDFKQNKKAWAVYADATFHASDRLAFNLGGRYSKEKQDVTGRVDPNPLLSGTATFGALFRAPNTKSETFSKFTPRASIRYEIADRTNIYASYSKGFRSGAYNSSLPANPSDWVPARQESVNSYEVGVKGAGSNFRFDLAGFLYDYKDLHVSATVIGAAGQPLVALTNAPKAKIKGVEASFEFEPVEELKFRGGATFLHARYGSGFAFSTFGVANAGAGGGVGINTNADPLKTYFNVSQVQNLSGHQMSRAPNFAGFLGVNYFIPNDEGGLRLDLNARYTDSYVITNPAVWGTGAGVPTDRQNKQRFREGAYTLLNASVTWTEPNGNYYVQLFGTNLTDKRYRLHYTGNTQWGTYSPMAEPRVYGVKLGINLSAQDDDVAVAPAVAPPAPPPPAPVVEAPTPQPTCNKGPYIVFFEWDRAAITGEAAAVLDSAVSAYGNCTTVAVMLAGHADRSGKPAYNVGLSERRNAEVRSYLTGRGIPVAVIASQAFGESSNRVATDDGARELQNRRVEINYGPGSGN